MGARTEKIYQYKVIIIPDRGHITDPRYVAALNLEGADGWKHREEQAVGSSKLAILLERELVLARPVPVTLDGDVERVEDLTGV